MTTARTSGRTPPGRTPLRVGLRGGLRVLAGLLVVLAAAVLVLPDLLGIGDRLPFVTFVVLRPVATVVLAVLAVVRLAVTRRGWPTPAAVLVVCAVAAVAMLPRLVPDPAAPTTGERLTLLSANVYEGGADVGVLADLLRRDRPDLVVLPESAEPFRARLVAAVPELGYRSWVAAAPGAPDVDGTTVLAAPSVGDVRAEVLPGGVDPWLALTGGRLGRTTLVAVHTAAPVPGKIAAWPRELASLQRWCGRGAPVVLSGDFNATLDHAAFRDGTAGCDDTGERTGEGLVATWYASWPRWFGGQIDHVLTTGGPTAAGLDVVDVPGSDHRALRTTLTLPR